MTGQRFSAEISRRSVLQGLGVGALGLAGAALLGCGGAKSSAPKPGATSQGTPGTAAHGSGNSVLPLTAPVAQGKPRQGGTFVEATTQTYRQHDPGTALGTDIWHMIGEKGLEPDPITAAIRPHVFTSWEIADPSGTTLVFKMNPNLFIQNKPPWNGRQFTAEDAAWNLERIGGLYADRLKIPLSSFQRASMVGNITRAQATDPLTVKVSLSKPNSAFFNGLMDTRVPFAPKEMDDIGWTDPLKMAGIGPYQVTEWVTDEKMSFKRNDTYSKFRPNEPHFDNANWIIIPDRAATVAAFIGGQIDLIGVLPPELDTIKKAKPDTLLYTWIDSNWPHFRPSVEYAPFKDFRVRKAIFESIDYAAINDGYYGTGWAYQGALCPGYPEAWSPDKVKAQPGYNPDTKAKDRADAAQMLSAAGYPNGKGIDFDMIYQNISGSFYPENTTRFQAQMATVFPDMKVTLHPYPDSPSFSVPQAAGTFKLLAYVITSSPDAVIELTSQYHTDGSRNYGHFSDPNLDALVDKAAVELNQSARTQMLDEAQTKFFTDWMPMFVLCALPVRNMLPPNIGGYETTAGTWYGYSSNTKVCRWFFVDK